jgi:hypothetical protein
MLPEEVSKGGSPHPPHPHISSSFFSILLYGRGGDGDLEIFRDGVYEGLDWRNGR